MNAGRAYGSAAGRTTNEKGRVASLLQIQCDVCGHAWVVEATSEGGGESGECARCFARVFIPPAIVTEPQPEPATGPPGSTSAAAPTRACLEHQERLATHRCDRCAGRFCGECVTGGRAHGLSYSACRCGGAAIPLGEEEIGAGSMTVGEGIREALTYPFRGQGKFLILIALGCFLVLDVVGMTILLLMAMVGKLMLSGAILGSAFQVILQTANGEDEELDWQEFESVARSVLYPFLACLAVILVCWTPAIAVIAWTDSSPVLFWLLLGMGSLLVPGVASNVALHGLPALFAWRTTQQQICRTPKLYAVVCLYCAVASCVTLLLAPWLGAIPLIGATLTRVVGLTALLSAARLLGFFAFYSLPDTDTDR
jgi:hypothetical protein